MLTEMNGERGTRCHRKTRHHRYEECTSLCNVKSSTQARKVVRHVSGRRREARFQDIVDSEAAQTATASASEPHVETPGQAAGGPVPSSSSGPEDPRAVRSSRLVATQVNTYAREGVTQATPPNKASRIIVSRTNSKGQHDCLIVRHDIRVAFFQAKGAGEKGIGTTRSLLEMCESVVRNTRGEQVLGK